MGVSNKDGRTIMQRICKVCSKPIFNLASNICSTGCLIKHKDMVRSAKQRIFNNVRKQRPDSSFESIQIEISNYMKEHPEYNIMIPTYRDG